MPIVLNFERTPAQLFSRNLVRIKYIQHIQNDLANCDAARLPLKVRFLNQSYVLQLIAFWQVFIEELANYGFDMIEGLENKGRFREIAKGRLNDCLKRFNTPNKDNIDRLFKEALGIPSISDSWCSDVLSHRTAVATLGELLNCRHQIAHTGRTSTPLSYESNFANMDILMQMADLMEAALVGGLETQSEADAQRR